MAIEGDIQALLEPLAAGGCYPVINPYEPPTYPFITYQVISSIPEVTLDGPDGTEHLRVQIDAYADNYPDAKALETQIKTAMAGASFTNVPISSQDLYEEVVKEWRQLMEFSVWSQP